MPPNRKHIGITAPAAAWRQLGELLEAWRRIELGYRSRVQFASARLRATPQGNANVRLVSDIENSYRPVTYPAGTLKEIAEAYGVAYESMVAVLRGQADHLTPAVASARQQLPAPPIDDAARTAADRPYADRIWADLRAWAAKGVTDPSGAQLFGPGTPDAQAWDGTRGRMDDGDRVWHIADLQRRDGDRRTNGRAVTGA